MQLSQSYRKVQYDLRPAKQAERKMLLDAFRILASEGFRIEDYQYTGMGSIHFIDFILFHKYLGISKLLSVEIDETIAKRIEFNKPFHLIETKINPIGSEIGLLSKDRKHILWLDYDSKICDDYLRDISQAAAELPSGSVVMVTIDVEPPGPPGSSANDWREYFISEAEDWLRYPNSATDFAREKLPSLNTELIKKAITRGLEGRPDVSLLPMFNFLYADGHKMITVGGMIGTNSDARKLQASGLAATCYFRKSLDASPFEIRIPKVTRKERFYLDSKMPCPDGWMPEEFELSLDDVVAYRTIYRFLPAYAELIF